MTPTFASAAAGNNASTSRTETAGDWARRTNGATQTFRRPSHATTPSGSTTQAHSRDISGTAAAPSPNPGPYVPPFAQSGRNGASGYTREQLLECWRHERDNGDIQGKGALSDVCIGSWGKESNGSVGPVWGRRDDPGSQSQGGLEHCWNKDGSSFPLSLNPMTDEEKEVFASSVNSPIKPLQNTNKDGTPKEGLSLRKTSMSQGGGVPYGVSSPTTNRPSNRRRDPNEGYPFPSGSLASPAASRFSREESNAVDPPPALVRRRTDFNRDAVASGSAEERDKEKTVSESPQVTPGLKRTSTAPLNVNNASWAPMSSAAASFSPMGAFGSFAALPSDKKPGYGSLQGRSRFAGLMSKSSAEQLNQTSTSKSSLDNPGKAADSQPSKVATSNPPPNNTVNFSDEEPQNGGGAPGDHKSTSPSRRQGLGGFATPHKRNTLDGNGHSAFRMTDSDSASRDFFQSREPFHETPQHHGGQESPTDTNPYRSPNHERTDDEDGETDPEDSHIHYPGMGSFPLGTAEGSGSLTQGFPLAGLGRVSQPFEVAASDRSQTSSVGPSRGFPVILPGLGSAWAPGQQPSVVTPVRDRGLGGFDAFGEAQSPSLAGLGSGSLLGMGANLSSISRPSRLESLFPNSAQEHVRQNESRTIGDEGAPGDRQHNMPNTFGRGVFTSQPVGGGTPARDTASPLRRALFDPFGNIDKRDIADSGGAGFGQHSSGPPQASVFGTAQTTTILARTASAASSQPPNASSPAVGQVPNPQERQMVMPDRMRWIYKDPNGVEQGPFTGLEMHDWYTAGFFSPELLIKKQEDPDYAPLAQLIRRIGNSREPFLVPQIGIPHGPSSTPPGNAWGGSGLGGTAAPAQPPFASSFPNFGTTLTAEQQNALERRKQEEQTLIAIQKEHLAAHQHQQAMAAKQMATIGHQIMPHQLQHHSSAHSLHSQPSLGSITSPVGHQPPPTQGPVHAGLGPVPGFFDFPFRPQPIAGLGPIGPGVDMLGGMPEDTTSAMLGRMNLGRTGQQPLGTATLPSRQQQTGPSHDDQILNMFNDRARLEREQQQHDQLHSTPQHEQQAAQASADRLQQFHDLRVQTHIEHGTGVSPPEGVIGKPSAASMEQQEQDHHHTSCPSPSGPVQPAGQVVQPPVSKPEPLSLTEQVQKAASAKQAPSPQMPWAKVEPAIHPFPPPPSQSPLPAPAAQRKPIVADNLAGESRSRSETPAAETPSASIAPWAKEPTEAPKGPSLKEIQEAEARKAAELEAIAAAVRREAMEKEMAARVHSPAAQPGLPSSSTWASGASANTPLSGQSPWAKPTAGKAPGQQGPVAKKTLQQIQKEEEQRKQRAAAAAAANAAANSATYGAPISALSSGKRYADLASKQTPTPQTSGSGAWTTVGASGKVKAPGISAVPSPAVRTTSAGVVPTIAKKPSAARSTTLGGQLAKANAQEEFRKWAVAELRAELNKGIDPDEMVKTLLAFPEDLDLITEAVHSASRTLDSRHFASEFLRRHKLAEKGVIDTTGTANPADAKSAGDGWNEVAKKGAQPQAAQGALDSGNFKVVAAKKKTTKR